jgi:hypothetical protein
MSPLHQATTPAAAPQKYGAHPGSALYGGLYSSYEGLEISLAYQILGQDHRSKRESSGANR